MEEIPSSMVIPRYVNVYLRRDNWINLMNYCLRKKYIKNDKFEYVKAINDLLEYAFKMINMEKEFEVVGSAKSENS